MLGARGITDSSGPRIVVLATRPADQHRVKVGAVVGSQEHKMLSKGRNEQTVGRSRRSSYHRCSRANPSGGIPPVDRPAATIDDEVFAPVVSRPDARSEEHTSELQS